MKPILIRKKEKIIFLDVTGKHSYENRRLGDTSNCSSDNSVIVLAENRKTNNSMKKKVIY